MKSYLLSNFYGDDYKLVPVIERYARDNSLAVFLYVEETEEPFATLTVNINESKKCKDNAAYIDINNCDWAPRFLLENNLAKPTGNIGFSGWCAYPEYKFNIKKLNVVED